MLWRGLQRLPGREPAQRQGCLPAVQAGRRARQHAPAAAAGELWEVEGRSAGWWRSLGNLTHAVVRNAGHMAPHDRPREVRWLVQSWVARVLGGGGGGG